MDLTERLGFKAEMDLDTGKINFQGIGPGEILERRLSDLQPVLAEQSEIGKNPIVHRIYSMVGDIEQIVDSGLKFDITVVMPHSFGKELPKTTGHYHKPLLFTRGIPTPDFCQIVYGKGLILVQRENNGTVDAYKVDAREMQHTLIPPWMGHLTVNLGDEPLVFSNICIRTEHLDYGPYLSRRGAAFYLVRDSNGVSFVQNPKYPNANLGELKPSKIPIIGRFDGTPFYPFLKDYSGALRFLSRPQYFMDFFSQSLKQQ